MPQRIMKYAAPQIGQLVPRASVLLVDDDVIDLEYHYDVLQSQGHNIVAASSSYEHGAALFERGDFDLLVVSQGSPAFEGKVLVERATSAARQIPVIVLAGRNDMKCYLEAMQLGAVDYLEKPVPAAEMRRVISTCLSPKAAPERG
ncbi:MAG: response regulator [Terriglobia bacterium]